MQWIPVLNLEKMPLKRMECFTLLSTILHESSIGMGINTVPYPPNSPDLAPWDFWLFPKLRGCRYETIEEMKEAVTCSHKRSSIGASQKLWERYNKYICSWRRSIRTGLEFHVCNINKSAHTKKVWKLI